MSREIVKVLIKAFDDEKMEGKHTEFSLPINPESYSRSFTMDLDDTQAQGTAGTDSKSAKSKPEEIKLEFLFDSTGTMLGYNKKYKRGENKPKPVPEQIEDFLKVTYNFKEKIHQPRFLKVCWGDLVFRCKLKDIAINYTLFAPSGQPLRAKINATFQSFIEQDLRVLIEDKQSPDLTHIRIVKSSNQLHQMTYDIYGTNKHYLKVALANNLTSPRLIRAGQELVFPPLKKV